MSKIAASLRPQSCSPVSKAISRPPAITASPLSTTTQRRPRCRTSTGILQARRNDWRSVEDQFVGLLIKAGQCQHHKHISTSLQHYNQRQTTDNARSTRKRGIRPYSVAATARHNATAAQHAPFRGDLRSSSPKEVRDHLDVSLGTEHDPDKHGNKVKNHGALLQVQDRTQTPAKSKNISENDFSNRAEMLMDTATLPDISRQRYTAMVDIYAIDEGPVPETKDNTITSTPHVHYPLASRLVLTPAQEEAEQLQPESKLLHKPVSLPAHHLPDYKQLSLMLEVKTGQASLSELWALFDALPSPQVRYLDWRQIQLLFQHAIWSQYRRDQNSKNKVFDILEQCEAEGIHLSVHEWTSAITLAGRNSRHTASEDLKQAIEMWVKMEETGVKADHVVFHALYDLAVKAKRFALADTIYDEMRARGMPLNRYFRGSMIQRAGHLYDGDAVRAAFNDFVHAGEIVDTAVMNLVLRSLISAGEGEAAEHVFANMKTMHADKFPYRLPAAWQDRRRLIKEYNKQSEKLRAQQKRHESSFFGSSFSNNEQLDGLQKLAPVHPDATSYRMLIRYHASYSGNLARHQQLIDEMKREGYTVDGTIYNNTFEGFRRHGGHAGSAWRPVHLEATWRAFTSTMKQQSAVEIEPSAAASLPSPTEQTDSPLHFSVALAKNALNAFYKCCGKTRMLEIWKEIQFIWHDMSFEDRQFIGNHVRHCVQQHIWQTPDI